MSSQFFGCERVTWAERWAGYGWEEEEGEEGPKEPSGRISQDMVVEGEVTITAGLLLASLDLFSFFLLFFFFAFSHLILLSDFSVFFSFTFSSFNFSFILFPEQ